MPRLLRRLTRIVQAQQNPPQLLPFDVKDHRSNRPASLHQPTLPFVPDAYPLSILLEATNPVATPNKYVRHKTLPPRIFVPHTAQRREGEYDGPRQMTEEERMWWSSPYLRMLASPPRLCVLSDRLLPSAFLLRLAPLREDDAGPTTSTKPVPVIMVPDGLQHPQYTARRSNRSAHVLCSRQAISLILENKKVGNLPGYAAMAPNLDDHISHLLRLRILQELKLLIPQLRAKPKADILANPPIRRLSYAEWTDIQENRRIPWPDAVAVINVPPIPDEVCPSMSPFPPPLDPQMRSNAIQPVAALYPVSYESPLPSNFRYRDTLPVAKTPLYNVVGLFPHIAQRAMFSRLLDEVQEIYPINDPLQCSDAYLFSSNGQTAKLGDMVWLAIAMWRVYLFERAILRD